MDTIGGLLKNNLSHRRSKTKNAAGSSGGNRPKSGGIVGFDKTEINLDRLWQRLWELNSEESNLLDQI